jgi:hypothetical protein
VVVFCAIASSQSRQDLMDGDLYSPFKEIISYFQFYYQERFKAFFLYKPFAANL